MNERSCGCGSAGCCEGGADVCYIDTYKIFDSCRDQLCLEDMKIMLTDVGQDILNSSSDVRVKMAKIVWTKITGSEMPFNRGYYQIKVRYYFYIVLECCAAGTPREISGIAVHDQTSVLAGGESSVSTFKSDLNCTFCSQCAGGGDFSASHQPQIVLDVVDPVVLDLKVRDACSDRCCYNIISEELPEQVAGCFDDLVSDHCGCRSAFITLGVFAVLRLQRASQMIVPAAQPGVPDKECSNDATFENACALFKAMSFPVDEFFPQETPAPGPSCGCSGKTLDPKDYK